MDEDRKKHCLGGCCRLRFTVVPSNRPAMHDVTSWAQVTAIGEVCGEGAYGHIKISTQGL